MVRPTEIPLVAQTLISYGKELYVNERPAGVVVEHTPDNAANRMPLENANAFLFAVIFDEGIKAERAWAAPYLLQQRVGHFDMARFASANLDELREAIASPPALHRYVEKTPKRLIGAAQRLISQYAGDASNIWANEPTASDVLLRLRAFDGIGQKKAAMAVNLLRRDLLVPIRGQQWTEVAYDIHIRRVFMRTGLSPLDDADAMNIAARAAHPDDPGALDVPAWYVGRTWCRPVAPLCGECRLASVCPRLTHAFVG